MPFNAQEFVTKLSGKNGVSRRTHFQLEIVLPNFLKNRYDLDHLTIMAVSANIPSINLDTVQLRRSTVSIKETFPTNVSFGDLSVTFFSDGQGKTLTIFKDWLNYIFPINFSADNNAFRVPYKSDYSTVATITHFDPEGSPIVKYKFNELYPAGVQDIQMNWGAFEDIVTLSADFKYTTYSAESLYSASSKTSKKSPVIPAPAPNNRLPWTTIIKK